MEQIDKSEDADVQRDRIVAFSLVGRRLVLGSSVVDCQPRVTYSPPKGGTHRGPLRILSLATSQRDSSGAGKARTVYAFRSVRFDHRQREQRLYLPPLRASLREEAGCDYIVAGKGNLVWPCPRRVWECPRESWESPREEKKEQRI